MKKDTNKILITIGILYILIVFLGSLFAVAAVKEMYNPFINFSPDPNSGEKVIYPEDSLYFYDIEDTMPANME